MLGNYKIIFLLALIPLGSGGDEFLDITQNNELIILISGPTAKIVKTPNHNESRNTTVMMKVQFILSQRFPTVSWKSNHDT